MRGYITDANFDAYRELYGDTIFFQIPNGLVHLEINGKEYQQPWEETNEMFAERLSRCTVEKNVFAEEWPEFTLGYSLDIDL